MKKLTLSIIVSIFLFTAFHAHAQCKIKNNAFRSGEKLTYDLYYKYGIVNSKAGIATLQTRHVNYRGKNAYKMEMKAKTLGLVNTMFTVRDTLTGYLDMNLVPMLFTKGALEGKDYTNERQIYTYPGNGKINIRTIRNYNGRLSFDETITTDKCTYDMITILAFARSLDYSGMRHGQNSPVQFITGKKLTNMYIRYLGTGKQKMNDGKTYDAIHLSLMVLDNAFEDQEEAMNVWLTNDENKLPLVIESNLKIGKMRVVLKNYTGNRHPIK